MTVLDDAGEVAHARGLGQDAMTLRPGDATVRFLDADGHEVVLTFDELAAEAGAARAARQAEGKRPTPHAAVSFEFPRPSNRARWDDAA